MEDLAALAADPEEDMDADPWDHPRGIIICHPRVIIAEGDAAAADLFL